MQRAVGNSPRLCGRKAKEVSVVHELVFCEGPAHRTSSDTGLQSPASGSLKNLFSLERFHAMIVDPVSEKNVSALRANGREIKAV